MFLASKLLLVASLPALSTGNFSASWLKVSSHAVSALISSGLPPEPRPTYQVNLVAFAAQPVPPAIMVGTMVGEGATVGACVAFCEYTTEAPGAAAIIISTRALKTTIV